MTYSEYVQQFSDVAMGFAPQLVAALVVLVVGWVVIKGFVAFVRRRLTTSSLDASLHGFITGLLSALLNVLLLITFVSMLGVQMTSFIALLGAAGLAVGLALQGSLANFAGGVLILARKPFMVGEFVTGAGVSGTVEEINLLYTRLKSPDGQVIFVPNGKLSNSEITNFSRKDTRRVSIEVGISYDDDIDHAKRVLKEVFSADERLLEEPGHTFQVFELGDDAVGIRARAWATNSDYWGAYFDLIEAIKKAFDEEGISFPYPQRDVYLYKQ